MKITLAQLLSVGVLAGLAVAAASAAPEGKPSSNLPVTELHYVPTGGSDGVHGELQAAKAYGDFAQGAHGTFIKMPAGFVSPVHAHTEDYRGIVISGVGVNGVPGTTDVPLPPGSYWFQKGGERHITKCISANECIFFISQSGRFDYLPDAVTK